MLVSYRLLATVITYRFREKCALSPLSSPGRETLLARCNDMTQVLRLFALQNIEVGLLTMAIKQVVAKRRKSAAHDRPGAIGRASFGSVVSGRRWIFKLPGFSSGDSSNRVGRFGFGKGRGAKSVLKRGSGKASLLQGGKVSRPSRSQLNVRKQSDKPRFALIEKVSSSLGSLFEGKRNLPVIITDVAQDVSSPAPRIVVSPPQAAISLSAPLVALVTVALLLIFVGSLASIVVLFVGLVAGGLYFLYAHSQSMSSMSVGFQQEHGRDMEHVCESENPELIADAIWALSSRVHQWEPQKFTLRDKQVAEEHIEIGITRLAKLEGQDPARLRALFFPQHQNFTLQ